MCVCVSVCIFPYTLQDHLTKNITIKCVILRTGEYPCIFVLYYLQMIYSS